MVYTGTTHSSLDMKTFALLAVLLLLPAHLANGEEKSSEKPTNTVLLSLTAGAGSYTNGELMLQGIPGVVWFSDRPERDAGHLSLAQLGERWKKGEDNFSEDPPNATLAIAGVEEQAVLELISPTIEGDSIKFAVKVISGAVPANFQASALFIDFACGWGDSW